MEVYEKASPRGFDGLDGESSRRFRLSGFSAVLYSSAKRLPGWAPLGHHDCPRQTEGHLTAGVLQIAESLVDPRPSHPHGLRDLGVVTKPLQTSKGVNATSVSTRIKKLTK
jgi:hypothetical protein